MVTVAFSVKFVPKIEMLDTTSVDKMISARTGTVRSVIEVTPCWFLQGIVDSSETYCHGATGAAQRFTEDTMVAIID